MTQSAPPGGRDPSHRRGPRGPYNTKPRPPQAETYILICLNDPLGDTNYCLATTRIFPTRQQAADYAKTIHPMRKPLVVAGDWVSFRLPE